MRLLILPAIIAIAAPMANAQKELQPAVELKTTQDKVSYALGLNIGRQFQSQGLKVKPSMIAAGIQAILADTEPALTPQQIQEAFTTYQAEIAAENMQAAKDFLEKNKQKEGVITTKTGMKYTVLKEGTGKKPTTQDTVSTHYRGMLLNKKVFDESYKGEAPTSADEPVSFGVTQVIAGWTEALQLMKTGAKYRLFIPPELAYGERGPAGIGPNSLLIFDIELLSIK